MSNQGIRGFYQITETIKDQLLDDININTVSSGEISNVNLGKQDIFPLGHILVNSVTIEEQALRFNITVLVMDIVNRSKEETIDRFKGNTNEQNILNTQLSVINKLIQVLKRGSLHTDMYQLDGDPSCEPFYDRFENELAGWSANMDILIYNDITIC
ncbi:MAG: hypothetical protein Tp1102DCM384591_31 [Prokaryotic dsDNA virus sp.]|jgi:hypothetical protein|nr:MAG: hypothetical protein Tp1102DCM384591_31 [Prokaryotic dsDNA virus sp.]|tara:strand:+ start:12187 stop:12657 length:471 start_codon:yes stop_codon:yes gene_type:complete